MRITSNFYHNIFIKTNYYHNDRSKTTVEIVLKNNICRRFMMSGRSMHYVARAAYHGLVTLSSTPVLDQTNPQNHQVLTRELSLYSLDDQKGIPQHKTTLMKHMLTGKFRMEDFYAVPEFKQFLHIMKTQPHNTGIANIYTDCRVLNELPTLQEYLKRFHSDVEWVIATGDSVASNFPFQQQTNQDFWVMVRGTMEQKNRALSLKLFERGNEEMIQYKCVPHDEKSGMDMFKRSTRGTLGYLTYDSSGIIPFITTSIDLKSYNIDRIQNIKTALSADNQLDYYMEGLNHYLDRFRSIDGTKIHEVRYLHEELQHYLWTHLQIDPIFQRSISFILTKHVEYDPYCEKAQFFKAKFIALLESDHMYNLDKKGDFCKVYRAMLTAYRDTVDSDILFKIHHLKHNGVGFNVHFLHEVANLIKNSLI